MFQFITVIQKLTLVRLSCIVFQGLPGRPGETGSRGREGLPGLDGLPGVTGPRGQPGKLLLLYGSPLLTNGAVASNFSSLTKQSDPMHASYFSAGNTLKDFATLFPSKGPKGIFR